MYLTLVFRTTCLALGLFLLATTVSAQPAPPDKADAPSVEIIYTGKLLGYFRSPSLQPATLRSCPGRSRTGDSAAATKFLKERDKHAGAILVGTGDNFSPQLEARVFTPAPTREKSRVQSNYYEPGNKELYNWNPSAGSANGNWLFYQETDKPEFKDLKDRLARGVATIPVDNVGCFLAEARFAAVVPGKHDFYFGAERVRQLARFMAGLKPNGASRPPQMLGANLVIKSARIDNSPADLPIPTPDKKWKLPDKVTLTNFKNGSTVYPWLSVIRAQSSTTDNLLNRKIFVCRLSGDVNQKLGLENTQDCQQKEVRGGDKSEYSIIFEADPKLPKGKNGHFATLEPGRNYALCFDGPENCISFSVYVPFFIYPRASASIGDNYTDPDPYVLVPDTRPESEVAIFGVVDRNLGERVGALNFSWLNVSDELKTTISVEDPGEALRQQLDYFHKKYEADHHRKFSGIKVLLAQMSPQIARVFAARFAEFQIVVAGADDEQATPEIAQETTWTNSATGKGRGSFVAVPSVSFDRGKAVPRVSLGVITASPTEKAEPESGTSSWRLTATANLPQLAETVESSGLPELKKCPDTKKTFREHVVCALRRYLPDEQITGMSDSDRVKWLTLWAIRQRIGADVALLQKRDFFPAFDDTLSPEEFQSALDRILWKGDLLTLLYVPGSAIKTAMEASKTFTLDDSNPLSLVDEKSRGVEALGVAHDGEQYLINEAPLEDKKLYAVATTDYIGAGDTGYPAFAAAALNPKTRASQFPEKLDIISGVVCRQLFENPSDAARYCLEQLTLDDYLDHLAADGPARKAPPDILKKAFAAHPFSVPGESTLKKDPIQDLAQQRPVWLFSLKNLSFTFSSLSNNLTDEEIDDNFAGVSASGVTAKRSENIKLGLDLRVSRSSHTGEPFIAAGIDYHKESLGDGRVETPTVVSQKRNRATAEGGYLWNLRGGRSQKRFGLNLSVYFETQLESPFTDFKLANGERKTISHDRSLLILPRIGLRFQNAASLIEAGFQIGRELNTLRGYRFDSGETCLADSGKTFSDCIKGLTTITKDSGVTADLTSRPRAGLYVRSSWSVPISDKLKYEVTHRGDLFFRWRDSPRDTFYWDESKHSLKFPILWPSLTIGPSVRLLFYRNKTGKEWLFQREFGFETSFTFDLFNRRESGAQLKYKK